MSLCSYPPLQVLREPAGRPSWTAYEYSANSILRSSSCLRFHLCRHHQHDAEWVANQLADRNWPRCLTSRLISCRTAPGPPRPFSSPLFISQRRSSPQDASRKRHAAWCMLETLLALVSSPCDPERALHIVTLCQARMGAPDHGPMRSAVPACADAPPLQTLAATIPPLRPTLNMSPEWEGKMADVSGIKRDLRGPVPMLPPRSLGIFYHSSNTLRPP